MNEHTTYVNEYRDYNIAVRYLFRQDGRKWQVDDITISDHPDGNVVDRQTLLGTYYESEDEAKNRGLGIGQRMVDQYILDQAVR